MAVQVSKVPMVAPVDHASRPYSHVTEPMSEVRTGGPGWATTLACGACGNTKGNTQVWHSWWVDRGGDATSNDEIVCNRCGVYSLYITEH